MTTPDVQATIDAVWKLESARLIGALARIVRDVGLAESFAQDALVAALERWPSQGLPDNPGAWLMTVARRRAIDHLRRERRSEAVDQALAHALTHTGGEGSAADAGRPGEEVLPLLFLSCHPVLASEDRGALTLRLVAGLSTEEIARAYLVPASTVIRRIGRAKRSLAAAGIDLDVVLADRATERLPSVLEVLYLLFNEGYTATNGRDLMQPPLCFEALRLARLLAMLSPDDAEVHGLAALLELQSSRLRARVGPAGEPVPLHEQDRGRWDRLLIRRGLEALLRARDTGQPPGPYVLQAAIAACHAEAPSAEATDWGRIVGLYDGLLVLRPSPVVHLNRAVAIAAARGPEAGLAVVDTLATDPVLRDHHHLPSVRGDLLTRLGRHGEARAEFARAARLTGNAAERDFLVARAASPPTPAATGVTLGEAAAAFLARPGTAASTRRSYAQTLDRLRRDLGEGTPLAHVTAADVTGMFERSWGQASARTWNRHRAAARSFAAWAGDRYAVPFEGDPCAALGRRSEPRVEVVTLAPGQLDLLVRSSTVALRERTLWSLLEESGAAITTVLALDVEHLDLDDRVGRPRGTGAWVTWRSRTAALLPELLAGRTRGPLFLTDRRPGPARGRSADDLCPDTGRARLSYERAEHLFKRATRELDPAGEGFTLGRLRRSLADGAVDAFA